METALLLLHRKRMELNSEEKHLTALVEKYKGVLEGYTTDRDNKKKEIAQINYEIDVLSK